MGHRELVVGPNMNKGEALTLSRKLGCNGISYAPLPHLFGDQELPFVYDEAEVDFTRSDNPVHRYQIAIKPVKKTLPQIVTEEYLDEWTGEWKEREITLTEPVKKDHYRHVGKGIVVKEKVIIPEPVMVEIEFEEEVIEEIEEASHDAERT